MSKAPVPNTGAKLREGFVVAVNEARFIDAKKAYSQFNEHFRLDALAECDREASFRFQHWLRVSMIVTRTGKAEFTIGRKGGGHWAGVTAKLKISDLAHLAGAIGLTYEDLGKAAVIVSSAGVGHAGLAVLCEELGVEFNDPFNSR